MKEAIIHRPGRAAAEQLPVSDAGAGPWPGPRLETRVPTALDLHAEDVLVVIGSGPGLDALATLLAGP